MLHRSHTICSTAQLLVVCRKDIQGRIDGILNHTQAAGVGVVGIRVLAGGALSGSAERHPVASPPPAPIGSAPTYEADLARAGELSPLVTDALASSLSEAATRFAISHSAIATILVGMNGSRIRAGASRSEARALTGSWSGASSGAAADVPYVAPTM